MVSVEVDLCEFDVVGSIKVDDFGGATTAIVFYSAVGV